MARYFIDKPVFACVISIMITLAGLFALRALPIEQYPNITPPQIQVQASYAGADAKTVAEAVAAPLEQQINGVENMIYMFSQNSATGNMSLSVFFDIGSDADMAQVNVQNRVNQALAQLPETVQHVGVTVQKQTPSILLIVSIESPDGRYDDIFVSNYATINVVDELLRLPGVSDATIIGARDYSMRIWLRPDKMAQLALTSSDVVEAVQEQNKDFAGGMIGRAPNNQPVQMTVPVSSLGRLSEPHQFDDIILRSNPDGSYVQIKDIGHTELGAQNYDVTGKLDGKTCAMIAIYQQYGANALDVAKEVKKTMERLSKSFPPGMTYTIPYDTTDYIYASIREVTQTIFEAAILVSLVVLVFLQSVRATIIPFIAMLVSIIGTFAGMYVLGYSINTLTLFGLVLAIGTVVDDAIVVIENVERNIRELNLSPIDAAYKAMEEVSGPIVAIVFVLCAVFIPVAFMGGIAGKLYQQFAITIAVSVVISGIVALTLSPALAALLLRKDHNPSRLAVWFNRNFDRFTETYLKHAKNVIARPVLSALVFLGVLALLGYFAYTIPTSFVPQEDQGYIMVMGNLPDGASLDRTQDVDTEITDIALKEPGVRHVVSLTGFSLLENLNRTQMGTNFITLNDWSKRDSPQLHANAILYKLARQYMTIPEARIIPFNPPAIQGLGTVGGFEFWIESRGDADMATLESVTREVIAKAMERPELVNLTSSIQADNLQLYLDIDRYKARSLGVPIDEISESLQVLLGSLYVNNFNKFGRVFQVTMQAEPAYRRTIQDIDEVYVRSKEGEMIPLKSLVNIRYAKGPTLVSRFNGFNAAKIIGSSNAGFSSGQAMAAMKEVAREVLPSGMTFSWSGESYQEKATGGTGIGVMLIGIVMVYLILSALYERWSLALAILLSTPFGIMGAFFAIWLRGLNNDIYFEIGLVTLIALAAKNAILIVEFALIKRQEKVPIHEAALQAAKMRFRAILMTSLTFVLGVIPLVFSSGAGAASRHSVGTGVFGGMIVATILAVFFVPLFYKTIAKLTEEDEK